MRAPATRGMGVALIVTLSTAPGLLTADDVDPYATSTKTCQAVINDDLEGEFPSAKGVEWDMDSVVAEQVEGGVLFSGEGSYRGDSGRRRTYDFQCEYDEKEQRVVAAWWASSFDRERHDVVEKPDEPAGPTQAEVTRACREAVESQVRKDFEHSIRTVELLRDTIERTESEGRHELIGQGRFLGGGGGWHRFDFTCVYHEDDEAVTRVSWKHLGNERDLED